jgi:hypothetical protein
MKKNIGMAPYWRGGVPVERGDYPAVLEWRPQREKTDNPEIFQGWISDIESVLAMAGISLVTQQTGGGRIIFSAAGHKVAELRKTMSGMEGTVFSRPVGGPGPGAAGQVAAEQIRRSSTWLGYGQPIHTLPVHKTVTATPPPTTPEYTLAPEVAGTLRTVEAHGEELGIFDPGDDPHRDHVDKELKAGTTKMAVGGALTAAGVVGGIALAAFGGKVKTGTKILSGVAAAASGVGGSVVGVGGYKQRKQAQIYRQRYEELDDLLSGRARMTSDKMGALANYDANFYSSKPRQHPAIAAQMDVLSKNTPEAIASKLRSEGSIWTKVQGLTIEDVPRLLGHPVWAEVGHIEAEGRTITVCSPPGCTDPVSGQEVWLHVLDTSGTKICKVRAHRYRGTWNFGWFPGYFDSASRQCIGCTRHEGSKAAVDWLNGYDNFEGSGAPPAGFYMRASSNSWLNDIITGQTLGAADMPSAGGLESEKAKIRGPMGAVMQAFRSLRAASPEVSMMYWPGTWDVMQMCAATAKFRDARAWWMKVGDWIGTLFGVAAFVCEVATPIISAINPAVGAAIGAGMSLAISAGQRVTDMVEGRPGGVLDIIGNLGWTATELQGLMRDPLDPMRDFSNDVGDMVHGWLDSNGLFAGMIGDLGAGAKEIITEVYNPATQYRNMIGQIYSLASSNIQRSINLMPVKDAPFYVSKMSSFSSLPKEFEGAPFPMPDPREYYALP